MNVPSLQNAINSVPAGGRADSVTLLRLLDGGAVLPGLSIRVTDLFLNVPRA